MTTAPSMTYDQSPTERAVATLAAVALPGAGHAYLGETRRAILIACGVLGLFFGGLLIGGIDVVDRKEDFVWFLGQGLVGPIAFGADYYHQNFLKVRDTDRGGLRSAYSYEIRHPENARAIPVRHFETGEPIQFEDPKTKQIRLGTPADRPPNSKSIGRVNELGTLMSAVAGMLNLICIIDAATRQRVARRRRAA